MVVYSPVSNDVQPPRSKNPAMNSRLIFFDIHYESGLAVEAIECYTFLPASSFEKRQFF